MYNYVLLGYFTHSATLPEGNLHGNDNAINHLVWAYQSKSVLISREAHTQTYR